MLFLQLMPWVWVEPISVRLSSCGDRSSTLGEARGWSCSFYNVRTVLTSRSDIKPSTHNDMERTRRRRPVSAAIDRNRQSNQSGRGAGRQPRCKFHACSPHTHVRASTLHHHPKSSGPRGEDKADARHVLRAGALERVGRRPRGCGRRRGAVRPHLLVRRSGKGVTFVAGSSC